MKKYIYTLVLALGTGFLTSCDDYLDVVPKGKDILKNVDQYSKLFNNVGLHNYPSSPYANISDDCWLNPSSVKDTAQLLQSMFYYRNPASYDRLTLSTTGNLAIYGACYDRINKISNIILDNIGDAEGDNELRTRTLAEAYALRAYNYFYLVNIFGKTYNAQTAEQDLSVPLFEHYGLEGRPAQASVAKAYQLIESDLEKAIPNLSNTPENAMHFSKAAGYALKAKVHLMKKEFDKAKAAATESYKLNSYVHDYRTISTLTALMKVDQNKENLYFAGLSAPASVASLDLGIISPELAGLFGATYAKPAVADTRFTMFFSYKTTKAGNATLPNQSGKLDVEYAPAYDTSLAGAKFFCYNSAGLRTTDVILILAECCAREGDYAGMKKYLDEVRSKRITGYTSATENPTSATEAVNIVITERRKELLGGFNRWCDLRRLNTEDAFKRTLTRTSPANPSPETAIARATFSLPPDSWQWVVPLPQDEFPLYGPTLKLNVPF